MTRMMMNHVPLIPLLMSERSNDTTSFWEHIDVLRHYLLRCIIVVGVVFVIVFCCKDILFKVILYPQQSSSTILTLFYKLSGSSETPLIPLINTGLAQQFLVHIQTALATTLVIVLPYLLYELMLFVAPALYSTEKKVTYPALIAGIVLFYVGVALNYFFFFPIIFHFLGTYQVAESVPNYITLQSYIDTLLSLSAIMGLICELPILCLALAKLGVLNAPFMRSTRKYAIVIILIVAAIITPTGDAFTLLLVALPIYLLYEGSILLVSRVH